MANVNFPRGLQPIPQAGGYIPTNPYKVAANYGTAIFHGDPVVPVTGGYVELATDDTANQTCGPVVAILDASGAPATYCPATPGEIYTVMVADDPDQLFVGQEDSAGGALAFTECGNATNLVAGTGNTTTGLSGWTLDSSETGTDDADQVRLIRAQDRPDNAYGNYCDWVVKINNHTYAHGSTGTSI